MEQKAHICYSDLYMIKWIQEKYIILNLDFGLKYVYPFGIWIGLVIAICHLKREVSDHLIWKLCIFQMTNLNFLFSCFYK